MAGYDEHSISVLEGLEAVRKRPGMYIGSVSRKGLNHLIYEIVDNSVDEHLAGACDTIHVTLEKNGSCTVEDNGRGVPVGMHAKGVSAARLVYTTLHAGGKFDDSAYKTSGGLHGVGSSVVNALSVYMDVEISREGYIHHDRYERGVPVVELENGLLPKIGKTKKTGTKVNFLPDPEIFEKTRFKEDEIKSRMHETAYLNPKLTIIYEDRRGEEVEHIVYHEEDGIRGFVKDLNKNTEVLHDVVYFKGESEGITVEAAFQYTNEFHENILGFCNNIFNAEGGTHITGFKTVFTTVINSYARELGILKEKDVNFTGADVRNGMTAVVSIKHPDPRFEGQTKTKLDNQDAAKATAKVTGDEIQLFFDKNLETLKAVISCAEKAAKIRKTEERAKTKADYEKAKASLDEYLSLYGYDSAAEYTQTLSQMKKQLAEAGFAKENMDSALQKKTQFENDNDMDKLLAPNECPYTLDELNEMISKVEGSLDEIRASLVQYGRQMDDLQEQLDMRDEKEQEYRNCKQIQAEEKHKYEILGLTSDYLTRAREQFTARYMAPISNGFQKYFGILTENTDRDWQVDANISIRMKEQGQLRDVRTMSAGYKDLIGICMRFALVDAMYPGEKPFLILDDPFVNLDDEKLARGRRLLAVLSQDYQVIYFTCHGSRE